ncbi:MAG: hypothetical protein LBB29_04005, partial [Holosporaceae bacterium]|nr:hypothetical protein [Holosporaceae bacterium]
GSFVYTLASVVDDIDMGITHIIRGDDHVTNTATQIDIFKAICGKNPEFAHVPLMSAADGQEVSKRIGSAYSICHMRDAGILPEAIFNFLATLGTSNNPNPSDSVESLVEKFSFEKMSLASPKFFLEELQLLSKKILCEKSFDDIKSALQELGLKNISEDFWNVIRENINCLREAAFWHEVFYGEINVVEESENFLQQMLDSLPNPFDFDAWIACLKDISGKKGRNLFHPIRMVLTGIDHGPELKKIANIMGYNCLKHRIEKNLMASK